MAVPVSELEPFIVMHAPDAPSDILQHVIREATVRFMRRTRVAVDEAVLHTQCGVQDYRIEMPDCRELIAVEAVEPDIGSAYSAPFPGQGMHGWDWMKDGRHPVIYLGASPKDGDCLQVQYSWTIGRDDCDIPDFIYEEWEEAIKHGALSELLLMPNQEWTRPNIAERHAEQFMWLVADAKARKWHNYTQGPLQMTAPPFAAPRFRRRR